MSDNAKTKAELHEMEATFASLGWRLIMAQAVDEIEVIKDQLLSAQSWDEALFLKGRAYQLAQFTYLEDLVANLRAEVEDEEEAVATL